jgi:prepilin-type N-terminal cleavage/methylation domain-containing protein
MKIFTKSAFSLVEISVVILIIGILIAGISQGIDLYSDYRLVNAKNLTKNSRVGRINDLEIWLETTSENSFATGTGPYNYISRDPVEGEKIGLWRDINPRLTPENRLNIFRNNNSNNQPIYSKNGINSIPTLKFDNDDSLNTYSYISQLNTPKFSTFLVMNHNNLGGTDLNFILYSRPGSIGGYSLLAQKLANIQSLNYMIGSSVWHGAASLVKSTEIPIIVTFIFDGATTKLYRNGVLFSGSFSGSYVQNSNSQTFLSPRGHFGEFIYFSRNLTDPERVDIEKYLSQKWSIKLN